ncbi:hypothetical protein PES01_28560 [Pseudoalteromonas espejiana]|uniref:Uncharacterized protein n=1 Tax=Pseudoalteromonas espejiana TaxID=28107 RepID=A0A510XZE9_9GAMM|nr:hypothetical protein PES01_28560 [Pseudoalteromonas espejiana]
MNLFLKKKKLKVLRSNTFDSRNAIDMKQTKLINGASPSSIPLPDIIGPDVGFQKISN